MGSVAMGGRLLTAGLTAVALLCCASCSSEKEGHPESIRPHSAVRQASGHTGNESRDADEKSLVSAANHKASSTNTGAAGPFGYLHAESKFVFNGGLSSREAGVLLRSHRSLSDAIDRLSQESASSPEAQDLTGHYRSSLVRAMGNRATLERLSCGLSLCIGVAHARSESDHAAWNDRFGADPAALTYSYMEAVEAVGGGYESRFIFSTDPALNSISGD